MKLRVATCLALPEPDADAALLAEAFARAGIEAAWTAWDDPAATWDDAPVVIRSTWNYTQHVDAFERWLGALRVPVWNPPHVVRGNLRKRYLLALAARGIATVPTTLVERGAAAAAAALPAGPFVVKPEVGAGSWMTRRFEGPSEEAAAFLAELTATRAALVQPYVASVEAYGERSLVWLDGELSHAIRKSPRFFGDAENTTGPFPIADDERALALAALAPVAGDLLYGRVDLARDAAGRPMIMELELVEPSLFFARQPGSADRFVAAVQRRI